MTKHDERLRAGDISELSLVEILEHVSARMAAGEHIPEDILVTPGGLMVPYRAPARRGRTNDK